MTAPLTPPGCDLRGLPYFPVDVARLRDSDLWQLSTPEQFKPAFALWCRSWLEVPAASIPKDEAWLARAAGVSLDDWRRLAPMSLRGWIECDDGRLYHPVIADRACRAWLDRLVIQEKSAKGNASRYGLAFSPETWAAKRSVTGECLARLTALAEGVVPQGEQPAPTGSENPSSGSDLASEGEVKCKEKRRGRGSESLVVSAAPKPTTDEARLAFDAYNETASALGLPVARTLDATRRRKLTAALQTHGLDGWHEALSALSDSPFCLGQTGRWRADLDFLLQPKSFARLIEGSYKSAAPVASGATQRGYTDLALEACQ